MAFIPIQANDEEFTVETRLASPAHFLTKLKYYSKLSENRISKVESMEFEAGSYKWKLIVYPDGDDTGKKGDYISVYLSMVGTNREVNAIINFFLYDHISDYYLCFRGKTRRFNATNTEWGISKFMAKQYFAEPSNGYLFNDSCVFGAEVFVITDNRVYDNVSVLALTDPYEHEWEIPNFSKQLSRWESQEFSAGECKWKIRLYPKGDWRAQGKYISIFLSYIDANKSAPRKKVRASCWFILRNKLQVQKDYSRKVCQWYTSSEPSWGFPQYLEIGDAASKGFIVDDCCHLKLQLFVEAIREADELQ